MRTAAPIPTRYKGYFFRSRLEARWDVFFDHLDLTWDYEPEGYVLDGTPYLPDFKLVLTGDSPVIPGLRPTVHSAVSWEDTPSGSGPGRVQAAP